MRSEQSAWCISNDSHGTDLLCELWSHALKPEERLPPVHQAGATRITSNIIRSYQANAEQYQGVTNMAFEAPPAQERHCSCCGEIKPLNFFGLDQQECRNCEAERRRQQAMKQNANDVVEEF